MKSEFEIAITQLCSDRNLSPEVILDAISAALESAYKRNYGTGQNIKVELVDILHFWVSACQVMGLSAEDVFRMYAQKNAINAKRQDTGYITKDESDNLTVG